MHISHMLHLEPYLDRPYVLALRGELRFHIHTNQQKLSITVLYNLNYVFFFSRKLERL
jgi:hypothetical protein